MDSDDEFNSSQASADEFQDSDYDMDEGKSCLGLPRGDVLGHESECCEGYSYCTCGDFPQRKNNVFITACIVELVPHFPVTRLPAYPARNAT
jgi:hypothetical protein